MKDINDIFNTNLTKVAAIHKLTFEKPILESSVVCAKKKSGFVKTQAKNSAYDIAMRNYMNQMEYINDILKSVPPGGKISDNGVLEMAQKATGRDFSNVALDNNTIRSLRTSISDGLKEDLGLRKKYLKTKMAPEEAPTDSGEIDLLNQLEKKEKAEDVSETQSAEISPLEIDEIVAPEIEEAIEDERSIEQDALEAERIRHERKKKRKEDIAGAIHPLDLFDQAIEMQPDGSSKINGDDVLDNVRTITGKDYSNSILAPEAVEAIRAKVAEYYRPKVSEDEESDSDTTGEPTETFVDDSVTQTGQEAVDVLPAAPPVISDNLPKT